MHTPYAYFDLDDTLIRGDSILHWLRFYYGRRPLRRVFRLLVWLGIPLRLLGIIQGATLKRWMLWPLCYERPENLDALAAEFVRTELLARLKPEACYRLFAHREAGHRVVVISASGEFYLHHLKTHLPVDDVVGTRLDFRDGGRFRLPTYGAGGNMKGWGKHSRLLSDPALFNREAERFAYSDSIADKPLLGLATRPVCVDPDPLLIRRARRRRWPLLWTSERGWGPTNLLAKGMLFFFARGNLLRSRLSAAELAAQWQADPVLRAETLRAIGATRP